MKINSREENIIKALLRLVEKGENIYDITVSMIAKEAGIGKGTIYEYFSSKEEVFLCAVRYSISSEVLRICGHLDSISGFKECFMAALDAVEENINNKFSAVNVLISSGKNTDICGFMHEMKKEIDMCYEDIYGIAARFIEKGISQGIIKGGNNEDYIKSAFISCIGQFVFFLNNRDFFENKDIESGKETTYKILVTLLGGEV